MSDCRCPVVAPLDIYDFVCFVLSNFYHARWDEIKSAWAIIDRDLLAHTISRNDKKMLHVRLSFKNKKIDEVMWFSVKESAVKETDEKIIWKLETGEDL